jgi:RsiW-degrading membrane proteinase PrsW (M82 family)
MNSPAFDDPVTMLLAIVGGLIPAFLWLRFWLKEDKERPEPAGLLSLTFIGGMLSVILVLPLQKIIAGMPFDSNTLVWLWAGSEEILKFLVVLVIVFPSSYLDEPVDYPIYFIVAGLGFAALENALFLVHPVGLQDTTVSLLTGNLRFLGSTLLHAIASGFIGLIMGLSFYQHKVIKFGFVCNWELRSQ